MASTTISIFEPFPWLILNRSRKICLALQCIGVAVCSTASFHKSKFIFKNVSLFIETPLKCLFRKLLTLIIITVIIVSHNLEKKLIKVSQKRGKIMSV